MVRALDQRLTPADRMAELGYNALELAARMESPARGHHEGEDRIAEAERIAAAMRRVVRG